MNNAVSGTDFLRAVRELTMGTASTGHGMENDDPNIPVVIRYSAQYGALDVGDVIVERTQAGRKSLYVVRSVGVCSNAGNVHLSVVPVGGESLRTWCCERFVKTEIER